MKQLFEILESLCIAFIIMAVLLLIGFKIVEVDGSSMASTLIDGERLIITNFFYTPEKGDIVVIDKDNYFQKPIVKRVIATGGDTIKIEYSTGNVYVNNELLEETYIDEKIWIEEGKEDLYMKIDEGFIFVMGDNRNHSSDSRLEQVGQINTKNVLGKAVFVISPMSRWGFI